MTSTRLVPVSSIVFALVLGACGDDGNTTAASAGATTGTTGTSVTTDPTSTTVPTTGASNSGTTGSGETTTGNSASGTTGGESSTGPGTSATTSTDTTATTSGGTTGQVSASTTDASTTTTDGTTTSDDTTSTSTTGQPCEPGDTNGMGDVEKSYLWVANTDQGSVSKVNTLTLIEEARYRTGPGGGNESPSRTAVSLDGKFVVVNNRGTGSSAMIAANLEDCVDKNGNGTIETSKNKGDILAFQADECLRWHVQHPFKGDIGSGPRGVTWTPGIFNKDTCAFESPKVWIGFLPVANAVAHMVRLDGVTGVVEETVVIPNWVQGDTFWGPYGAALDKDKKVWFTGLRGELFRLNTDVNPTTVDRWTPPPQTQSYGMTVDPEGDPWHGGCSGPVTTFDPDTNTFTAIAGTNACYRGLAADHDGSVWVASNGPCGVAQIDYKTNTLIKFHTLNPCSIPVGVSVDLEGFVWVVDEAGWAWKIDPNDVPAMKKVDIVGDHYTYSDMTGGQLKSVILPQ